jgi:hypothetical protein
MTYGQGVDMIVTLIQTLCALLVVYGAFLALLFTFDRRAPQFGTSTARPRSFHPHLREEA